jgi:hypothetical protein
MANLNGHEAGNGGYSQGEPIGTAPVLDPTDEEGRETRDGPLGEWTPDPKGRKRWGAARPVHDRACPLLYPKVEPRKLVTRSSRSAQRRTYLLYSVAGEHGVGLTEGLEPAPSSVRSSVAPASGRGSGSAVRPGVVSPLQAVGSGVVTFSARFWHNRGERRVSRFVYLARKSGDGAPSLLITGEVLCAG